MSDVVVPMVESCLLLVFGIMIYRGKLTGLLAGMSLLSGERLEEAKRAAETLGVNRMMGAAIGHLRNPRRHRCLPARASRQGHRANHGSTAG